VSDLAVCVFDLDHTLVDSPLDLHAVGREMEAFVRGRGIAPLLEGQNPGPLLVLQAGIDPLDRDPLKRGR